MEHETVGNSSSFPHFHPGFHHSQMPANNEHRKSQDSMSEQVNQNSIGQSQKAFDKTSLKKNPDLFSDNIFLHRISTESISKEATRFVFLHGVPQSAPYFLIRKMVEV